MKILFQMQKDFESYYKKSPSIPELIYAFFAIPGIRASSLYRIGNFFWYKGNRCIAKIFVRFIRSFGGIEIGISAKIGGGIMFPHASGIVIGTRCVIGENCTIMQGVTLGQSNSTKASDEEVIQPVLGNNVYVGAGAKVLGKIFIGDNAVIGANAVVLKDVPPDHVAVGVPARILYKP